MDTETQDIIITLLTVTAEIADPVNGASAPFEREHVRAALDRAADSVGLDVEGRWWRLDD